MKPRRLADLRRLADEAEAAFLRGAWWDGKKWRDKDDPPRHAADERPEYKDAIDVLAELNRAMVGDSDEPDSPERLRAARRFGRSAEADRDERSAPTPAEFQADKIFELAKPHLQGKRTPWTKLAMRISREQKQDITPNRLRMICRQRGAK